MKNLDLATLGVEEMNEVEIQSVDGGTGIYNDGNWGCLYVNDGQNVYIVKGSEWIMA